MNELEKIKNIFDSIVCLCVEGVEFMTRTELATKIIEEATKGYKICKDASQPINSHGQANACDCPKFSDGTKIFPLRTCDGCNPPAGD